MRFHTTFIFSALVAATLVLPFAARADESPAADETGKRGGDQAMKERMVEYIDARIRILESAKSCVRAAQNMNAMLDCHNEERRQTKALNEQNRKGW